MFLDDESLNQLRVIVYGSDTQLSEAPEGDPGEWLKLILRANQANNETTDILSEAVLAARAASVSWEAIGSALRISRQAAQQRFGKDRGTTAEVAPDWRRMTDLTAINEMAELNRVGRYGWHSVGNGPFYHDVVRDVVQWEHRRTSFLVDGAQMARDGWQRAGSPWFPWVYWARPIDEPALAGDPDFSS